jgi:hypothetical protein
MKKEKIDLRERIEIYGQTVNNGYNKFLEKYYKEHPEMHSTCGCCGDLEKNIEKLDRNKKEEFHFGPRRNYDPLKPLKSNYDSRERNYSNNQSSGYVKRFLVL